MPHKIGVITDSYKAERENLTQNEICGGRQG